MNVADFVSSLPTDHVLIQLLNNNIPNVEWQLVPTAKLRSSLASELDAWQFCGKWFALGRINTSFNPCVMPIISYLSLAVGLVPSLDTLCSFIRCSPVLTTNDVEPRVYQCYTAFLRELHCALYLSNYGTVSKNPQLDLAHGIDLLFRPTNGAEVKIAIAHQGDRHLARKQQKLAPDVVVLYATNSSSGVHLVDTASIDAKILSISCSLSSI